MHYNWKIIGHEKLLENLENDIRGGNLAHAYLFIGPEKVGKYVVAKTMAHILQCANNFCHDCPTCVQIEKSSHPETIEFQDDSESIKIDQMRDVILRLNMTSSMPYKILLIDRIERMTMEAANCLLKTLEEPPPQTLFLFTASNVRDVIPTILSRVRIVPFHHCNEKLLNEKLREMYPDGDEETLEQVCSFAIGKPGTAFHLMRDPDLLALYRKIYQTLLRFLEGSSVFERFCFVQDFVEDSKKLEHFLNIFVHLVRAQLLRDPLNHVHFTGILERIDFARFALRHNANAKLILEHLMLSLP